MKNIIPLLIALLFSYPITTQAGFDWGNGDNSGNSSNCTDSNAGSGSFEQQILNNNKVEVGVIPSGIEGVFIKLTSDKDVDIQLYDQLTGAPIIVWPNGILNGPGKQSTSYQGMSIEWSGYNGDGANYGHEYIKITGATSRSLIMKAFGYQEGFAHVDYSWTGTQSCTEESGTGAAPSASGSGNFEQQILNKTTVTVGDIPIGINNLSINLNSDKDVDIQLYDKDTGVAIIAWPSGILNGPGKQITEYQGMTIEWSGYNGNGTNLGHEYIKITGLTSRNLTMRAFGYQAGFATINYSWGTENSSDNTTGDNNDNNTGSENPTGQEITEALQLINQARSVARQCGNYGYFNAAPSVTWNVKLFNAALGHSENMANQNFFSHTGLDGSSPGNRISATGYNWVTYMENIAAGYSTAAQVVEGWLTSPGHCANIMNSSIKEIGLARANNISSQYKIYWTLNGAATN